MTYTVLISNSMLGTSRYCGTFGDREFAAAYVSTEAKRARSFVSYEVWTGTPRNPGKPIGPITKGAL